MAWIDPSAHEYSPLDNLIGGWDDFWLAYDLAQSARNMPISLRINPSTLSYFKAMNAFDKDVTFIAGIQLTIDDSQPVQTTWIQVFAASQPAPLTRDKVPSPFAKTPPSNIFTSLLDAWKSGTTLPTDSAARKLIPIHSGLYEYFPAACAAVAAQSKFNNEKHNPGGPLAWDQSKSMDQADCFMRHLLDQGDAKVSKEELAEFIELTAQCWRKFAELQLLAQKHGAPKPPAAK